jgi:hypothetical protein|tara:strand:- start:39 stop:218 length:180 start_codon:yes stop_codon:yes gene_type:complete
MDEQSTEASPKLIEVPRSPLLISLKAGLIASFLATDDALVATTQAMSNDKHFINFNMFL